MKLPRCLLLLTFAVTLCSLMFAQQATQQPLVPRLIRFSGQVKQAKPESRTVGITFSLHKSQDDNAALWIETQNVPVDASGKYTVLLGATKSDGIPMDLFTSGEAQWLSVRVEGQSEQPRVLLVSVPYAMKAAEAATLAGHPASEFVTNDKLSTVVQQQLLQHGGTPFTTTGNGGATGNVATAGATDFLASTTTRVVGVTQSGTGTALQATSTSGLAVRGSSTSGTGVLGTSNAATGTTFGVEGSVTSTSGTGVRGVATATTGSTYGVYGSASSSAGVGVLGAVGNATGIGVKALNTATSGDATGLVAGVNSTAGTAAVLQNTSTSGKLLSGQAGASHTEVFALDYAGNVSTKGQLQANTTNTVALEGFSTNSYGLYAYSTNNTGIYARTAGAAGTAVYANAGNTTASNGVIGYGATGVAGYATVNGSIGTYGDAGTSTGGRGVVGRAEVGVQGESQVSGSTGYGVVGKGPTGVYGVGNTGMNATSNVTGGNGISATADAGVAFAGNVTGTGGYTIDTFVADTSGGYAAWFNGPTEVYGGDLHVSGQIYGSAKHFQIDHPLDPTNKYLVHTSVESSEMKDIYDGVVTTDARGEAVVQLPAWFEALNGNFRYQLTPIGQFAQAIVATEIAGNRFTIKTDKPNVKVSWLVTGVRQDAYAKAHPVQVEMDKPALEQGYYLHPEAFGQPEERSTGYARRPAAMKHWKELRATVHAKSDANQAAAPASK